MGEKKPFFPVPMASLFDVDHWNSFSDHLPLLVASINDSDCWEEEENSVTDRWHEEFQNGTTFSPSSPFLTPMASEILNSAAFLTPIKNRSRQHILTGCSWNVTKSKLDLLPLVENCSRPLVYGGGSRGAGRLWNNYIRMPKQAQQPGMNGTDNRVVLESSQLISIVSKALRPKRKWREVAHQCVNERQRNMTNVLKGDDELERTRAATSYIALRARVELEMMVHRCSKDMEKNLSTIFEMVESFTKGDNYDFGDNDLQGIFLAVSRQGMQPSQKTKNKKVQALLQENWQTLQSRSAPAVERA